jgi:surfactin synthase thioesterase subunit
MSNTDTKAGDLTHWLAFHQPNPRARLRLFCFPYAGGGALTYRNWSARLPAEVEVYCIQHPGQGRRHMEESFTRLPAMIESLAPALRPYLDRPFAFFGHSMGALISFELARHVRSAYGLEPVHLFVSGRRAPCLQHTNSPIYKLPDEEFFAEICRVNKGASEMLNHVELMQLLLPHMRADFELVDTYTYTPGLPLNCPLTALGSTDDEETTRERLEPWRAETAGPFSMCVLPGDHFYLESTPGPLFQVLAHEMQKTMWASVGSA